MHTIVRMESCMGMGWLFVLCWHLLVFHFSFSLSLSCHPYDSFALLQFKTSFPVSFPYCDHVDDKTATWENSTDCCSWVGVTCHPISGHVIALDLSCSGLLGQIHPNSTLFSLDHLQSLNLAFNYFFISHFSSRFAAFVSLTSLNLSNSYFEGEIPAQISHLSKLQSLDLSSNHQLKWEESSWKRLLQNATVLRELVLDDTNMSSISMRPLNMSSSLVTLSLTDTGVTGKLTHDFPCLPHLQELHLSFNYYLEEQQQLPNLSCSAASLRILDLSWNRFQGPIPASFSNLTLLTSLNLYENNLNGSIPSSLLTLPRLTFLSLHQNHLSGQIPNVFPESNRFEALDLSGNKFGGELPSTLSNLQHLTSLDLSFNKLSGQIPDVFVGLTKLNTLHLSSNNLEGQIPSSLFDLTQLSDLDFSDNKLEGPLPNQITGSSNLTSLLLNNNLLNGTIPSWCLSLPSLFHLDLSYNQFTGQIPAISSLSLEYLYLCYNKLQGNIPQSILNLVNLTHLCLSSNNFTDPVKFPNFSNVSCSFSSLGLLSLSSMGLTEFPKLGKVPLLSLLDLSNNKLNGTVPKWLHEIDSLQFLNLSQNLLTAPINQFSRNYRLTFLDLSSNLLTDGISSSICNASSLKILVLSHNKLTGIIPSCLANLSSLEVLDLQMNKFYGSLPNSFSKDSSLMNLNLNDNQLQGLLPQSLSNCTQLEVLNLANNQIEDTFPNWLQTLPNLKVLVLRANKLHSLIESSKSELGFPSLVIFDISSNNFNGPIPKAYIQNFEAMKNVVQDEVDGSSQQYMQMLSDLEAAIVPLTVALTIKAISLTYSKIPTNLVNIDLSGNKFEGEIPNVIGELHALRGLNVSHNRLSGPIPQAIGNLTNMESLDLSSNMLTGRIPADLVNLNFLEVLNLSNNRLVGEIPRGKQFDTFSNDSFEGNLGLCGFQLSMKCNSDSKKHSPPSQNFWREERFGFGWEPVAIGYGCGMVFGVGIGSCLFSIRKPQWLIRMVEG